MAPFTEKNSCRHRAFNCLLDKELMCDICRHHESYSDRRLRELVVEGKEQKTGVCQRLHGSNRQRRIHSRAEEEQERPASKRRSSAPASFQMVVDEDHLGDDDCFTKPVKRRQKKGKLTLDGEAFHRTISDFRAGNKVKDEEAVKNGILRTLAGNTRELVVNPVGASRATQSKVRATAAAVLNGAVKLAVGEDKSGSCRDMMVANAYKRMPPGAEAAGKENTTALQISMKEQMSKQQQATESLLKAYAIALQQQMQSPMERRPHLALFASTENMSRPQSVLLPIGFTSSALRN